MNSISNRNVYIYGLRCPITEKIRYIGKSYNPKYRYCRHINENKNYHKCFWIKKLKSLGYKPEMVIIDEVSELIWQEAEIKYIRLFKSLGADLTNKTNGGDITPDCSGEKNGNWGKIGVLNHKSKPICVFTKDGLFIEEIGSMRLCSIKYNIDFSSIVRCCKGLLHSSKGYVFRYRNDYKDIPMNIITTRRIYSFGSDNTLSIPIQQYDLKGNYINSFASISQASKETGLSISSIRKNLANKIKPRKYEFRYKKNKSE